MAENEKYTGGTNGSSLVLVRSCLCSVSFSLTGVTLFPWYGNPSLREVLFMTVEFF